MTLEANRVNRVYVACLKRLLSECVSLDYLKHMHIQAWHMSRIHAASLFSICAKI